MVATKDFDLDGVYVIPQKYLDRYGRPDWWADSMDFLIGDALITVPDPRNKLDSDGFIRMTARDYTSVSFEFHVNWLDVYQEPEPVFECSCPYENYKFGLGCKCGAFEAEMISKGKVYNPVHKMWEKAIE